MGRKDYKQVKYTDEFDGPSSMQVLGNEKIKNYIAKNIFEKEREDHLQKLPENVNKLKMAKSVLFETLPENQLCLASPLEKRNEIKEVRKNLDEYNAFKQNQMFLGRRERIFKGGWRHGITGIDNSDQNGTSIFYQNQNKLKQFKESEKRYINEKRLENLKIFFGTSTQLQISSDKFKRTRSLLQEQPEVIVDISENWKKRKIVGGPIASPDTFKRIYSPASNVNREPEDGCMKKIKIERSLKLRKEDLRGKKTNVITNNQEIEENWLGSFGN